MKILTLLPVLAIVATGNAQDSEPPAGDPADLRTYWNNSLRLENGDGSIKLRIGGRLHYDWGHTSASSTLGESFSFPRGTETRRARMYMMGDLFEDVGFRIEYDFSNGEARSIALYMTLAETPLGNVTLGRTKEPMGLERQTSSNDLTFLERSLPMSVVSFRSPGIMLSDEYAEGRGTWTVGIFRESSDRATADSTGAGSYALTARVTGLPIEEDDGRKLVHLGASASYRNPSKDMFSFDARPGTHMAPKILDSGTILGDHTWVFGVESAMVNGPFSVQAEYAYQDISTNSGPDASVHGYYGFASFFPTGEYRPYRNDKARFTRVDPNADFHSSKDGGGALEVGLRYSRVEQENVPTGDASLEDWSVGLNWYLNSNARILTNYVLGDLDTLAGEFHGVTLRFQVAF